MNPFKICHTCKQKYSQHSAISRIDNKNKICPTCGIKEALIQFIQSKKTGEVQINKTTHYAYQEIYEEGTKTANSERVNYISQIIIDVLKQWKKEQPQQQMLM